MVFKSQTGEELDVDIYMTSYQEQMMRLGSWNVILKLKEQTSAGRNFKIKTLALFFIDDISSYRPNEEGKTPYLLQAFEKLLKERIESVLSTLSEHDTEYRAYLEASLSRYFCLPCRLFFTGQ